MGLDSCLLSPIASEVQCLTMFPVTYHAHQGWIAVTPALHQAPTPAPLPVLPPRKAEDDFQIPDYNQGGLYKSSTLWVMQDLQEAVTYKFAANKVHNLRPENK